MLDLFLSVVFFIPLIFGASWLIKGATGLARRNNIPDIVIGLTIVAFGTSAPEMVVNFVAAANGNSGFSFGNILGSNIVNILLVLGISAAVLPVGIRSATAWIEIPLCLLSALVLFIIAGDAFFDGAGYSIISRSDGIILTCFFIVFLYYSFFSMKGSQGETLPKIPEMKTGKSVLLVFAGVALLGIGGHFIVYYASRFADEFGVSERIIGLTILSIGTSLPELATSILALFNKRADISIGNIIGSNIFNAFLILGTSAIINPIKTDKGSEADLIVNILATLLIFVFLILRKEKRIGRPQGVAMVLIYLSYLAFILSGNRIAFL